MAIKQINNFDEQEMPHPQLRKTKICSFFQQGHCRYGGSCALAHNTAELEPTPDLLKRGFKNASLCKQWVRGICPFSNEDCRFVHGTNELRPVTCMFAQSSCVIQTGDATATEHFDNSALSKAAPPGLLLPTPFNIDIRTDSRLTSPISMDVRSIPFPSTLEPMKVTPCFAIGSLGGAIEPSSDQGENYVEEVPKASRRSQRPCKGQRQRFDKLVNKLFGEYHANPDNFNLETIALPPSMQTPEKKEKLRRRVFRQHFHQGWTSDQSGSCPQIASSTSTFDVGMPWQPSISSFPSPLKSEPFPSSTNVQFCGQGYGWDSETDAGETSSDQGGSRSSAVLEV